MNEQQEAALNRLIETQQSVADSNLALAQAIQALAAAVSEQTLGSSDDEPRGDTYLSGAPL